MTISDMEHFANHKYGDNVYMIKTKEEIMLYTLKSKWKIRLTDMAKFGRYVLYHQNYTAKDTSTYHKQCEGKNLDWLVYYAIRHDLNLPANFDEFYRQFEMYKLGREIEESIARFNFFCD